MPTEMRTKAGWVPWGFATLVYLVAAVAATWPLALQLDTHLPLGSLSNATVPLFNLWTLEWNAHSLARGYADYWNAPIFFPAQAAFALSEAQALTGIAFAAFKPIFGSVASYNFVLLAMLVLNGLCARRAMRALERSDAVATLAGLLALGMPFVWKELGVLQLLALWPIWLAIAELAYLAVPEPPPWAAARLGLWCAALLWTCSYYALFFAVFMLSWAVMFVQRAWFRPRLLGGWFAGALVLAAAAAPIALQQRALTSYVRSAKTIHGGSATALAYTRLPREALGGQLLSFLAGIENKRGLSPGSIVVLLAGLGVWAAQTGPRRRFASWCAISCLLALVLSFGSRWSIGEISPYEVIVERHWPGFGKVRSPYRFAAFVQLFLLVLAGFGLERVRALRRRGGPLLLMAAAILAFLEPLPGSIALARYPSEQMRAPWIEFLAENPGGAVAMIPPAMSGKAADYESTVIAMLQAFSHQHPLLNGYSGFFPPFADRVADALRQFPSPRGKRLLAKVPVRFAVVDKAWLGPRDPTALAPLERVFDSETHAIYWVPTAR